MRSASWYAMVLILSAIVALAVTYKSNSTLPWWGFLISVFLGTIFITFFGALFAITGLSFSIQPFVQMIAGFSECLARDDYVTLTSCSLSPSWPADGQHVFRFVLLQYVSIRLALDSRLNYSSLSDSVGQALLLLQDLKIAQYTKLPPRAAFTAQTAGTLLGAVFNFIIMNSVIDNQREILLSVEGTNIWSGQQPQQYNSQVRRLKPRASSGC